MIRIALNGKQIEIEKPMTVRQFLDYLNYKDISDAAVWINDTQVMSKEYDHLLIQIDDEVKVIRLVAGG